jgi:hypothetical protein
MLGIGEFLMDAAICNYTVARLGGKKEAKKGARDRWLTRCRPWMNALQKLLFSRTSTALKDLNPKIGCRYVIIGNNNSTCVDNQ